MNSAAQFERALQPVGRAAHGALANAGAAYRVGRRATAKERACPEAGPEIRDLLSRTFWLCHWS